jgi:hypothetical protein
VAGGRYVCFGCTRKGLSGIGQVSEIRAQPINGAEYGNLRVQGHPKERVCKMKQLWDRLNSAPQVIGAVVIGIFVVLSLDDAASLFSRGCPHCGSSPRRCA